ncbi:MAG: toprim domain-containing protein [Acetobacteraceae bacterium]|nr:toprim domain-containing protein [Acetobacteraceae bacterium]
MKAYERIGTGRVKPADETAESRKRVRGFWNMCGAARGTPVAKYLANRGLSWLARNDSIRYRAECSHPSGRRLPAMVALIWDGNGDICAVHRTYLTCDGTKADIKPVKACLGSYAGGAIRISPAEAEILIAEGLETAASAGAMLGLPAWSAIACGNMREAMVLPPIVRSVVIAADHDGSGRKAAAGAARRWRAEGRTVRIIQPDTPRVDFNDLYRARMEAFHAG